MLYQIDSSYTCMKNLNGNITVNKIKKIKGSCCWIFLILSGNGIQIFECNCNFWFSLANFSQKWAASQKKKKILALKKPWVCFLVLTARWEKLDHQCDFPSVLFNWIKFLLKILVRTWAKHLKSRYQALTVKCLESWC